MRAFFLLAIGAACLAVCGCDGDYQGQPGDPGIKVQGTPDLNPKTDHDVDVKPPDVDVDVERKPGELPKVEVDAFKTPDKDTKANP